MLTAALRDLKLSPDTVTARDMQRVLSGPLERRLSQVLPGTAALEKLRALSSRLERSDVQSLDDLDENIRTVIWEEEDSEADVPVPRASRNAEILAQRAKRAPTESSLPPTNQQPLSASASTPPSTPSVPTVAADAVPSTPPVTLGNALEPLEYTANATYNQPASPTGNRQKESVSDLNADQLSADEWNDDDAPTPSTSLGSLSSELDSEFTGDNFSADDFEFSDPDYVHLQAARKVYHLSTVQGQDALLYELARHSGVQTVVLCSLDGQVLSVRAPQGAPQLGSVVAATAMLFRQRNLNLLSADMGDATVCMRVIDQYCIALLARGNVNVGRLLSELQQIEVAA